MTVYACPKPTKILKAPKTTIKKVSDTSYNKLIGKCDVLISSIAHIRSGNKCEAVDVNGVRCNKSPTSPHHIIPKAQGLITRLMSEDVINLCLGHHDHPHKKEMDTMIIRAIGVEKYNMLLTLAEKNIVDERETKLEYVERQYRRLKAEFIKVVTTYARSS